MSGFSSKLLAGAAALGIACAGLAANAQTKVGFVYVGPVGDHGWTYQHDQARLAVEEAFGDKVETTFVENVAEGPDSERVIQQLAQRGHELIFTTSFGFMNPTIRVAERFPTCCSSTRPASSGHPMWRPIPPASTRAATSSA